LVSAALRRRVVGGKLNLEGHTEVSMTRLTVDSMSETDNNNGKNGFEEGEEPFIVRVGKKPTMNYVVACVTLFNTGVPEVMVRARGQSITKAVEVVDMLRRAFLKNLKIESVDIGTEEIKRDDGSIASLSTIEIMLGE
jgi:archaea-specific DNA-binding protein